jgi:hypothetical protein
VAVAEPTELDIQEKTIMAMDILDTLVQEHSQKVLQAVGQVLQMEPLNTGILEEKAEKVFMVSQAVAVEQQEAARDQAQMVAVMGMEHKLEQHQCQQHQIQAQAEAQEEQQTAVLEFA